MSEFASEAFESVTHADSRVWRTLWFLIAKPGFLTVEFVEGRRARFLPPFRLYLVLSVVLFLVAASVSHRSTVVEVSTPDAKDITKLKDLEPGLKSVQSVPAKPDETPDQRARRICDEVHFGLGPESWEPRLHQGCYKVVLDGGHSFLQNLYHNVPRALFFLLPLLALVMSLMYRRRYYVEHLLFFIHNHAFMFVLFTVFSLALAVTSSGWLMVLYILIILFYSPYYTYKAMRRVYAQGKWLTRLKFFVLSVAYLTFMLMLAYFTAMYSLLTL
ncbi:MAG TPA: DUF3667 domain-containing protein [Steroidobacteraceae bacterium]|jgi:hypothetical protein|nr:DUF3667 domain-containing protein [Steroidobacteraceae bacterium]